MSTLGIVFYAIYLGLWSVGIVLHNVYWGRFLV